MTSSSNLDPFEMWRQVVNKLEGGINSIANRSMNSEQFTRTLQQFSQISTGMQQTFDKVLDGYFRALRLPSQNDIADITNRLQRLENKLDQLLPMEQPPSLESRPLRTRQPSGSGKGSAGPAKTSPDNGG
jgi:predicted ribosome quality control (RQC) complex YloA/Tae2 family protein